MGKQIVLLLFALAAWASGCTLDFTAHWPLDAGFDVAHARGAGASVCPPLASSSGTVLHVSPSDASTLPAILAGATSGTTVLLADGTYPLGGTLEFSTPDVTLRSASGNPDGVTIDGQYGVDEAVRNLHLRHHAR